MVFYDFLDKDDADCEFQHNFYKRGREMKIEDLMVGDWVRNDLGEAQRVVELREEGAMLSYNDIYQYDDIQPIPLTLEILEKNGFEKLDFSHFQIGDRRLVLDADGRWDGPLSWHWVVTEMGTNAKGQPVVLDYYVATINYVHELQHCLKLVGIDKEIQI